MLQYISETRQGFNHAGSKARDDIEFILGKRYTVAFNAAHSTFYSGYDKLKYIFSKANINLIRDLLVCKNKTFVIQYPLPINKVYKQLFLNKTLILLNDSLLVFLFLLFSSIILVKYKNLGFLPYLIFNYFFI